MAYEVERSEQEWRERLSPDAYRVLREQGTERAFTGKLVANKEGGTYRCAACGSELFSSDTKYESFSGWPSFFDAVRPDAVELQEDRSHGMVRVEANCARCGSHLGHVFDDGPAPTGQRYCMNSVSLDFEPS